VSAPISESDLARSRDALVRALRDEGIQSDRVLAALGRVPRHRFVPPHLVPHAYEDRPLPIGHGQTISQPYIVALSTEALDLGPAHRVLEVGTGSGYQAAVLAELAGDVFTVERVPELSASAAETLRSLGYANVRLRVGDGTRGWPEEAPFDAILVTAASPRVPRALLDQLSPRGRMVIPVGGPISQELLLICHDGEQWVQRRLCGCTFVPLIGEEGWT